MCGGSKQVLRRIRSNESIASSEDCRLTSFMVHSRATYTGALSALFTLFLCPLGPSISTPCPTYCESTQIQESGEGSSFQLVYRAVNTSLKRLISRRPALKLRCDFQHLCAPSPPEVHALQYRETLKQLITRIRPTRISRCQNGNLQKVY